MNLYNINKIKYINTVSKSLLLNNNIKSINLKLLRKDEDLVDNLYLHNRIMENKNGKYDKLQKFINFVYN